MTPEQALQVLAQVVSQTRALPGEVDAMRQALRVLDELVSAAAASTSDAAAATAVATTSPAPG